MKDIRVRPVVFLAVLLLFATAAACLKVPYTGRRQFVILDFDQELQLGADAYKEIVAAQKTVSQGTRAEAVGAIGKQLSRVTPSPFRGLRWEFRLFDSKEVNAFCLPGGKVGVYDGIIPVVANEGGLAAVVGHEIGHAVARHGAERISGGMLLQLGMAAADVGLSNSELHDQLLGLMGVGATLGVVLPFSRANELEADYLGAIFMAKAGYDPKESVALWERMTAAGGGNELSFFSTHPSNNKRIERLNEDMAYFQRIYKKAKSKRGAGKKF